MRRQHISRKEITDVLTSLSGLPIARVWRGYGTAIFFELGKLHPEKNRSGKDSPKGDFSIMIEWSWRVERTRSIWFGAFSSEKMIESRLPKLVGFKVEAASLEGRLPELRLALSDGHWFGSYACEQGHQEWAIFTASHCYYAKAQSFYKENRRTV